MFAGTCLISKNREHLHPRNTRYTVIPCMHIQAILLVAACVGSAEETEHCGLCRLSVDWMRWYVQGAGNVESAPNTGWS